MTSLRGSGPRGRIVAADVLAAPAGQPGQTGRSASTGAGAQAAPGSGGTLEASMPIAAGAPEPIEVVPGGQTRQTMSKMRRAIASNLLASKQSIPHFYMAQKIDAGPMTAFYRAQKAHYPCSLNDVILAACARALMEFPAFRSRIDGDELVEIGSANIGVAVGTDKGLIVPVLVGTEQMPLPSLAAASKRMVTRAREGKIDGLGQGVFTISNLGMFGIDSFSAIINPPEAAILAVGTTVEEVIVRDGAMRPGKTMTLTLSCDHRVVDGLVAAQFTARLKNLLENPAQLA
jgi:pyruvate dehydrogenase E2 component (dihydrolipoamide acetyltransferase)